MARVLPIAASFGGQDRERPILVPVGGRLDVVDTRPGAISWFDPSDVREVILMTQMHAGPPLLGDPDAIIEVKVVDDDSLPYDENAGVPMGTEG